jgi:hypothetical protein
VLTDAADYPGLNNLASNPTLVSQYCNGARTPPEFASGGYQVPPGISYATIPNPIFSLSPAATVDEGNNWINIGWGPLALANPVTGTTLANYALAAGSPAIDYIPTTAPTYSVAPTTDFFGNPRPDIARTSIDVGAVEYLVPGNTPIGSVTGWPLAFGNVAVGTTSAAQTLTLHNTGTASLTEQYLAPRTVRQSGQPRATCLRRNLHITVVFSPMVTDGNWNSPITSNIPITGSPVASGTGCGVIAATLTPTSRNWNVTGIARRRSGPPVGSGL